MRGPLADIARAEADAAKLPHEMVLAIVQVESGWDSFRVRYEPGWRYGTYFAREHADRNGITSDTEDILQRFSWGLMQIMGAVAREIGYNGHLTALCDPILGTRYGCKKLRQCYEKYADETAAIAAYNAGSAQKTQGGMYVNQRYVDRVYAAMLPLRSMRFQS